MRSFGVGDSDFDFSSLAGRLIGERGVADTTPQKPYKGVNE